MKFKHNKKRNTIFIFESLVRELTKSVINKDFSRKKEILSIIKENFSNRFRTNPRRRRVEARHANHRI